MNPPKRQPTWTVTTIAAPTTTLLAACCVTVADDSFTLTLDNGQVAPCLLRDSKVRPSAVVLNGFASAAGRMNITTLAVSPVDVFAGADATCTSAHQRRQQQLLGPGKTC